MAKQSKPSFLEDIKQIMYGMGDYSKPRDSSALLMEEIVRNQITRILLKADQIAHRRKSNIIKPTDILFLMRKDKVKLQRFINSLEFIECKSQSVRIAEIEKGAEEAAIMANKKKKQIAKRYIAFLKSIGVKIEQDKNKQIADPEKLNRLRRAENISKVISEKEYVNFSNARTKSFRDVSKKFLEWLSINFEESSMRSKIKCPTLNFLLYLARETIAEIVDYVFLLREERAIMKYKIKDRALLPPAVIIDPSHAITPREIQEVFRRYDSKFVNPFNIFSNSANPPKKLFAC